MEWYIIYLWVSLDAVLGVVGSLNFVTGLASSIAIVGYIIADGECRKTTAREETKAEWVEWLNLWTRIRKVSTPLFFLGLFLWVAVPTSKQFAMIYAIPKIADSTIMQEDVPELYDAAVKALKKQLGEASNTD